MGDKHAAQVTCNSVGTVSFVFGLIGGTATSIVIKLLYQQSAVDSTGAISHFEKPMLLTFIMFVAMAFALPCFMVQQMLKPPAERATVPRRVLLWLAIPSVFDLLGTNFAQIGLVYTTVSYFQLLRCTVIVVTAFLKAFVLKDRLAGYMWVGVAINIVAMVLVSLTNFIAPEDAQPDGANNPALGVFFILLSCVVQGSQYIFEEKVMAVDDAPPLVVIGMEGLWGSVIMLALFPILYYTPGADKGSIENTWDSIDMVRNSAPIQTLLAIFFVTVTMYNIFCIYVTAYLSAIWHAILDNFRPVSVWGTDLAIFYIFTAGAFGEAWTRYSWLQAVGMLVLFVGTAVYNGSLRVPGLRYEYYEAIEGTPGMRAPPKLASPALMRSPLLSKSAVEYSSPGAVEALRRARAAAADTAKPPTRLRTGSEERQLFAKGQRGSEEGYL
ncbi:hypothetical protein JKP88DRAFT_269098 [Tribonema minus]|uniref:Uncharacterized protein n=1 Tax=Tribonema minus TaxID=303371 RepID=A0A836CAF8_9STRA|nr:hypothetical protein JKP88DRAFT_269098 [Tribonema minus]